MAVMIFHTVSSCVIISAISMTAMKRSSSSSFLFFSHLQSFFFDVSCFTVVKSFFQHFCYFYNFSSFHDFLSFFIILVFSVNFTIFSIAHELSSFSSIFHHLHPFRQFASFSIMFFMFIICVHYFASFSTFSIRFHYFHPSSHLLHPNGALERSDSRHHPPCSKKQKRTQQPQQEKHLHPLLRQSLELLLTYSQMEALQHAACGPGMYVVDDTSRSAFYVRLQLGLRVPVTHETP